MASVLNAPRFHDEQAAYEWVEERVWPDGPVCPHCGSVNSATALNGKSTRIGVYKCRPCRKPFTVKVGTIFEASHVPMKVWLQAIALLAASKKGISSNQLHRVLGVTLKTAWFMSHRIREAMREGVLEPLGGTGKVVEADETYIGKRADPQPSPHRRGRPYTKGGRSGPSGKRAVLALVERQGRVRTFHVVQATKVNVAGLVAANVVKESHLYTDESRLYSEVGRGFADHQAVNHAAGEYVRGEVHSNTVESYFSIFKRGMRGIYQHCAEKHLHRYLAEFDFRHNHRIALGVDDTGRAERIVLGVVGKRLTYQTTRSR